MGAWTRPWKSKARSSVSPTASRRSVNFLTIEVTCLKLSRIVSSSQMFSLTALKPRARVDGLRDQVLRAVAADPDVGLDAIALRAAEQRVNRSIVHFAEDVPKRRLDARDRAHRAGPPR